MEIKAANRTKIVTKYPNNLRKILILFETCKFSQKTSVGSGAGDIYILHPRYST